MRIKYIVILSVLCLFSSVVLAEGPTSTTGIGGLADNITSQFAQIGKLMIAISYIAGVAFAIAAIFKFKQHKDNPTQITLGTPLAMLAIGIMLVFLPLLFGPAGYTVFKEEAEKGAGGFLGGGAMEIPGAQRTGTTP